MANIMLQASGEGSLSASFPENFKNYMHTELYWQQKQSTVLESWVFWSRNDGIPEHPPNYIGNTPEFWDFLYQSSRSSTKLNEKIRAAFMNFIGFGNTVLYQFWEHRKTMEGRSFLTTQHLPFLLTASTGKKREIEGFCGYRMICKEHIYYVDDDACGVPGRVFWNQCPEISHNVEYYSPTEYPLRHHALRCRVKSIYAFPVFEPSTQTCLGVVEKVLSASSLTKYSLFYIENKFKDVGLKFLVYSYEHLQRKTDNMYKAHKAALNEISKMIKVACNVHKLRLAQIWVPCRTCRALDDRGCKPLTSLIKFKFRNYEFVNNNDDNAKRFANTCDYFHLRNGYGIVGRAHLSRRVIYCTNVTQFSLAEYPLSHCARAYGFSACFTICLQSSFIGNDAFVIEFFFPTSFKDSGDPWTSLREILRTVKENSQFLRLASGAELTEELPIEVIDFQNGKKLHYVSSVHELLKNEGMTQMYSSLQQSNDFQNVEKMDFVPTLPGHEPFQDRDRGMPQDSFDQQYAINNRSEIVSVVPSNINVTHSQEKITKRTPQRESKKGGVKIAITLDEIQQTSKMSLAGAAKKLEVGRSTLKRACRSYGYERWPPRKSQFFVDKESIPPLNNDMHSNHAPISIVNGKPQDQTAMQDANVVTMKAKYGNDITIKFRLTLSSTLADLEQHVAKRLKLEAGTYYIKYTDHVDDDLILIACDEDLQEFFSTSGSLSNTSFLVFLEPKMETKRAQSAGVDAYACGCVLHHTQVHKTSQANPQILIDLFPQGLGPFIEHFKDVESDGNCGYRAIGGLLGLGEEKWGQVRQDLLNELYTDDLHYIQIYGSSFDKIAHILTYFQSPAPTAYWMSMPEMGHLIASTYNVVLYHLSAQQCLTFLPLRSNPVPIVARKEICIGFVNRNHFVQLFLKRDHPIPPIATFWIKHHDSCAKGWETPYAARIQRFREIVDPNVATMESFETIEID